MKHWQWLCCVGLTLVGCSTPEPWLSPSKQPALIPEQSMPFEDYTQQSHKNILAAMEGMTQSPQHVGFLGDYTAQQAATMRAPFEWQADQQACAPEGEQSNSAPTPGTGKGFLLVHGLTDSPFSLRSVAESLRSAYPCALIRSVLLPGHGTWPGDTLKMNHHDWRKIVDYGVNSFRQEEAVQELHLVGYSTGTSLTVDYLNRHPVADGQPREDKIQSVVMMAPAVKANSSVAFLAPWVRHVTTWMSHHQERDAARYESFSYNAAAEFYLLTKDMVQPDKALNIPVMMVATADDTTVKASAAREFFCYNNPAERKLLLWYASVDQQINQEVSANPALNCDHIIETSPLAMDASYQTLNQSHLGVLLPPTNPHYGLKGEYRHCKYYEANGTEADYQACQSDDNNSVFGENPKLLKEQGKLNGRYLRRGTFNPEYDAMMKKVVCFVDEECELETVL